MVQSSDGVLHETLWRAEGSALWVKRAILVLAGIAALAIAAKIRVPMWPVSITMQTFVVLSIGAAYGMRMGVATILGYLLVGAFGFDVFTGSGADKAGLSYMFGATGGYLLGFAVAAALMGELARRNWDRSVLSMALAMLAGTAVIYLFGLAWMGHLFGADKGMAWVIKYGMTNFLVGDAVKLALAALVFPTLWKMVGNARG